MVIVQQNGRFSELTGSGGTVADMTLGVVDDLRRSTQSAVDGLCRRGGRFQRDRGISSFWSIFGIVVFTADAIRTCTAMADGSLSPGQLALTQIAKGWKPSKMIYSAAWVIFFGRDGVRMADNASVGRWRELRQQPDPCGSFPVTVLRGHS